MPEYWGLVLLKQHFNLDEEKTMKNPICHFLFLASVIMLGGCVTNSTESQGTALPERYNLPAVTEQKTQPSEGTIYGSRVSLDLYKDSRAKSVGDIVLVRIVESSNATKKASTKTEREDTVTGGITSMFGFEKWLSDKNSRFTPSSTSLQANLTNDFEGKGETKRNSNVTATLSARVTNVTIDGNLAIRAYQEVRVNNETQFIVLAGLIRPGDISQDNSILSSYIADARIEYSGKGALADKQQPGWLARGLDVLWPF